MKLALKTALWWPSVLKKKHQHPKLQKTFPFFFEKKMMSTKISEVLDQSQAGLKEPFQETGRRLPGHRTVAAADLLPFAVRLRTGVLPWGNPRQRPKGVGTEVRTSDKPMEKPKGFYPQHIFLVEQATPSLGLKTPYII